MKALILAAGLGTRLAPMTDSIPKCLVPVNGKPILLKQIDNLVSSGISDITIVSGYKAEVLAREVNAYCPHARIIENKDYMNNNNMYSAYMAREAMDGEGFLMMNADVFFDPTVISSLLACPAPSAIVTDIGRYLEESMKVVEENGRLVRISKAVPPEEALGASIDVYKFSPEAAGAFFAKAAEYIEDGGQLKLWSEVALNDILGQVPFAACPLDGRWLEIDTPEDLAAAEELFA